MATQDQVSELATQAKTARRQLDWAKASHMHGRISYDALAEAGKAFADAFYAYQVAKFGKTRAKRVDYRAVIR